MVICYPGLCATHLVLSQDLVQALLPPRDGATIRTDATETDMAPGPGFGPL